MRKKLLTIRAALALALFISILLSDTRLTAQSLPGKSLIGTVAIVADSVVKPEDAITVSIVFADSTIPVGGFSLYVEYDRGALVFDSATLGSLTRGEWEYFTPRTGLLDPADSSGAAFIRMVAIADAQDTKKRMPKPRSLVGTGELVKLFFFASGRTEYLNKSTYLRFIWAKCDDNSFSDQSGNKLYVSRRVRDAEGHDLSPSMDKYSGINSGCLDSQGKRANRAERIFDFRSAKILISTDLKK